MQSLKAPVTALLLWAAGFCPADAAESLVIDWAFAHERKPIGGVYGLSAPISIQNVKNAAVVTKESTPANPFPNFEQALHIPAGDAVGVVRIRVRPFPDKIPSKGSFEFQFHLVEGSIGLGVGTNPIMWDAADPQCYGPVTPLIPIFTFVTEQPVGLKAQNIYSTASSSVIEAGRNYAFRLKWEQVENELRWEFFLNDEPLLGPNGLSTTQVSPLEKHGNESLALIIQSGSNEHPNGSFFLGKIEVKSE